MNSNSKRHEVDAWERQMQRLAKAYREQGMDAEAAEEKAVNDVRREIRNGPPIKT